MRLATVATRSVIAVAIALGDTLLTVAGKLLLLGEAGKNFSVVTG
jgi:hypothetical protein